MQANYHPVSVRPVEIRLLTDTVPKLNWLTLSPVQIAGNGAALAARLIPDLQSRGVQAAIAQAFTPGVATAIIATEFGAGDSGELHWQALGLAREAKQAGCTRLVFVQETHPSHASGLSGLAKTAAREWPDMNVCCVDLVPRLAAPVQAISQAIACGKVETQVDANGNLSLPQLGQIISPPLRHAQPTGGVWLVTGGARGVTADCAIELAGRTGGSFALIGRSAMSDWPTGVEHTHSLMELRGLLARKAAKSGQKAVPAKINRAARSALAGAEIRATLAAIAAAGGKAHYYACDLTDDETVSQTIQTVQVELGTITGMVHGAGILADRLIMEKTCEEFGRVFSTKIDGLSAVMQALDTAALTHIAFFSSAAARFGNVGQSDYATANEILNGTARQLAQSMPHANVKSFNWGPWDGGMVDATLAKHFEAQGVGLIPLAIGARIFADQVLHGDPMQIEILVGDEWS